MRTASSSASRSPPDAIRTIFGCPHRAGAAGLDRGLGQCPASCGARTAGEAMNALLGTKASAKRKMRRVCAIELRVEPSADREWNRVQRCGKETPRHRARSRAPSAAKNLERTQRGSTNGHRIYILRVLSSAEACLSVSQNCEKGSESALSVRATPSRCPSPSTRPA
eukprot:scaffold111826_cov58-Phaeocystis_antarctica.AAC.1